MSFLSNLFGDVSNPDAVHQSLIDILCLSIAADGQIDKIEQDQAVSFVSEMLEVSDERAASAVAASFERMRQHGLDATLVRAASQIHLEEHREAAFLAATWVQYADNEIRPEEDLFLQAAADALQIDDAQAQEMINYVEAQIAEKQKG
jgi:uncharacterized tellurite resistance protein B-like protein